ncbi:hypothetical protein ELH68_11405 [Rhizobium ruizarguesonis]|nr:hypothetical protein ELH68_11405 [Rhizobium ruizarguesonis]TBA04710.1 hypothetical protein ELH64_09965 [Rhizobium ruizarguesonis]TBA42625.1 hypothetical protein ELH62_09810 [Rhizobium ruizarguesonis]TBC35361.1 hypothetical protein ELH33_09770 [Rhizobium ruizarguesonis]
MPIRQNSAQAFLDRLAVPIFSDAQFFRVITWVAQITAPATEQFSLRTKRDIDEKFLDTDRCDVSRAVGDGGLWTKSRSQSQ